MKGAIGEEIKLAIDSIILLVFLAAFFTIPAVVGKIIGALLRIAFIELGWI